MDLMLKSKLVVGEKVLGVDIGGSGIKGAIVNVDSGIMLTERHRIDTPQPATPKAVAKVFEDMVKHFEWKGLVGCGFPAIIKNGVANSAANIDKKWLGMNVEKLLEKLGYPTAGEVRGRLLQPKGILLRFSTAGVYFPWTGESNIDAGLHPVQIPFTLAHEFAHGYGFTDEGTCNFLAYLACIQSDNKLFRYSGQLSYWRYLASAYRRHNREAYKVFFEKLPKGVVADLYDIDANSDKYPDILPRFRDAAYDTYLKTQGISEGEKNYSRIIMLVKSWREK